jgi:polyisoprenoid-binding protein YceI
MHRLASSLRHAGMLVLSAICLSVLAACGSTTETQSASTTPTTTTVTSTATACVADDPAKGISYKIVSQNSEASYSIQEQFLSRDLPNTAVGKTKKVEGDFQLKEGETFTITGMNITVDLKSLTSDEDRRDNAIRERWLESNTYPTATFKAKDVKVLSGSYTEGNTVTFSVKGDMTIHNVTRPETFKVTGQRNGDTITGTATTHILMKNYKIETPNIAGFLTVKDGVDLKVTFTARKQPC